MKSKFDLPALMKLYGDNAKDKAYFLDKTTGEILTLNLANPDINELKKIKERIAKEPGRFPQVPKRAAHESYKDMEAFISSLKDIKLQKRLSDAIVGQSSFKCFRDVLEAHPRERQAWNTRRDEIFKKAVLAFLREAGVPASELP
jgi:hypothetical protein